MVKVMYENWKDLMEYEEWFAGTHAGSGCLWKQEVDDEKVCWMPCLAFGE